MTDNQTQLNNEAATNGELEEMIKVGAMFGHKKTKTDPKFKNFILTNRNNIEIIDLAKTLPLLNSAAEFLKKMAEEKKTMVLIGTQPAAWDAIDKLSEKYNWPFVKARWIGGLLTNFKILSNRLDHFKKTKEAMAKGEFDKYTKKERAMINKNISRMENLFGGLENLTSPASAIFLIDTSIKGHKTALREARRMKIPIVAIIDSDDNPELITYPIPANDHAKASIEWVVDKLL